MTIYNNQYSAQGADPWTSMAQSFNTSPAMTGLQGVDLSNLFSTPNTFANGLSFGDMSQGLQFAPNQGIMANLGNFFNNSSNGITQNQTGITGGLGLLKGMADTWSTFQSNKNAEKAMNFQMGMDRENLAIQKKNINSAMSDRQDRRVSANSNAESTESYMKKWGA